MMLNRILVPRVLMKTTATRFGIQHCENKLACLPQLRFFSEGADSSGILTGGVKWFDTQKGYGFIVPSDGSPDVFVHHSALKKEGFRSLQQGEEVEFKLVEDGDQRKAAEVTGPGGVDVLGIISRARTDENEPSNWS